MGNFEIMGVLELWVTSKLWVCELLVAFAVGQVPDKGNTFTAGLGTNTVLNKQMSFSSRYRNCQ